MSHDPGKKELRGQMTDEERIRYRDQLSDDERRKLHEEASFRAMPWGMLGKVETVSARLDQIEKRLDTLELKK